MTNEIDQPEENLDLTSKEIIAESETDSLDIEPQTIAILARLIKSQSRFVGPIPPPEMLKGYEEVLPGSADRILTMAEKQSQHRMTLEKITTESDVKRADTGLILAFIVFLVSIGAAVYLAVNGRELTAGIIVGANLTAVVGSFIYGTISRKNERSEKLQKLLDAEPKIKNLEQEKK